MVMFAKLAALNSVRTPSMRGGALVLRMVRDDVEGGGVVVVLLIVRVKEVERVMLPPMPDTVMVYVPTAAVPELMVSVVVQVGLQDVGE